MTQVRLATSGEIDAAAVRALLDRSFPRGFADSDWEHALGGVHALAFTDDRLVGHGSVVPRTLWHDGRALRCGYVEAIAVDPAHRRRRHGDAVMAALEAVIRADHDLGALAATDAGARLYEHRGWIRWRGPTSVRTPDGDVHTPGDDGGIFVLPVTADLDPDAELTCDWRPGDVW
jgi:aminoglycoside 2'-N-acetyltransferase I